MKVVKKGDEGELIFVSQMNARGINTRTFPSDYKMQVAGIDVLCNNEVAIDVKYNYKKGRHNGKAFGYFYIENDTGGWLFNPNKISEIVVHVCQSDTNQCCWYFRDEARKNVQIRTHKGSICKINALSNTRYIHHGWDSLAEYIRSQTEVSVL